MKSKQCPVMHDSWKIDARSMKNGNCSANPFLNWGSKDSAKFLNRNQTYTNCIHRKTKQTLLIALQN